MGLLNKYIWLLEVIKHGGERGVSYDEIDRLWQDSDENIDKTSLPKRTFHHQRSEVERLFDINIGCNRRTSRYFIENPEQLQGESVRNWIQGTFALSNILAESFKLKNRIIVDDVPSAHKHLKEVITAIRENRVLDIVYHSFKMENSLSILLKPYFIKMRENRWYVYGNRESDGDIVKMYALDRIQNLKLTENQFMLPDDFDSDDYLRNSVGANVYEKKIPQRIVLKAHQMTMKLLETLPMHHSQKLIEQQKDYSLFEYYLSPTGEFFREVLKYGEYIEIIEPEEVRDKFKQHINQITKLYN